MMYVDLKDLPIETADTVLLKAWEDRKDLRLRKLDTEKQIEALDTFIETYIARANPEFKGAAQQQGRTTFTMTGAAQAATSFLTIV